MIDRYYSFKIVTYHSMDIVDQIKENFYKYAYILHDKDVDSEGNPLQNHVHIVCTFKQNKSIKNVLKIFPEEQNSFVLPSTDRYGDFDYLTHANAQEKYQYNSSEVITNDLKFFRPKQEAINNAEFLNDILNSTKTYFELAIKYGRDYMKNVNRYKEFARICIEQSDDMEKGYNQRISLLTYKYFMFHLSNKLVDYCKEKYNLSDELCDKLLKKYQIESGNLLSY